MKLSIVSAFASQNVLASYTSITETLAEVVSNKTTKSSRSFMAIEQILISDIKRYGCWCYLSQPELDGTSSTRGKAAPMDEIDENCRVLQKGYECISMDFPGCDGRETNYVRPNIDFYSTISPDFIQERCREANPSNDCEYSVCTVEQRFLTEYVNNAINSNNWAVNADSNTKIRRCLLVLLLTRMLVALRLKGSRIRRGVAAGTTRSGIHIKR
jgi:hypothetical protein